MHSSKTNNLPCSFPSAGAYLPTRSTSEPPRRCERQMRPVVAEHAALRNNAVAEQDAASGCALQLAERRLNCVEIRVAMHNTQQAASHARGRDRGPAA